MLREAGDPARVVIVGHDPDFSELIATLSGAPESRCAKARTPASTSERPLEPGGGILRWLVPPDLLKLDR